MMAIRMTEEEYRALTGRGPFEEWSPGAKVKKAPKYKNTKTTVNGITFDSKHEAEVWIRLEERRRQGELKAVLRQVSFPLANGTYRYRCDFLTIDRDNRVTVIDAKSAYTRKMRVYVNKKKEMAAQYGLEIVEM